MKLTYGIWGLLFLLAFFTAGLFPAIFLTGLAITSSVTTGFHVQDQHSVGGRSFKQLR